MMATKAMVTMFENGKIYIAPNLPVSDLINEEREEELLELIIEKSIEDPTIDICEPDDFEYDFLPGLKNDYELLKSLNKEWIKIGDDPKLEIFIDYLKNILLKKKINPTSKLIVFSESKETTEYLYRELPKHIDEKILMVDSKSRKEKMPIIRSNFDANILKSEQKNDFNIVLSTEVLAEGINLHRANVIVNYDTPWNSTRLMQRIGRVNRIGSIAKEVFVYNFYPTAKVNNDIELEKKAIMKLQAFHAALGEDSQIYSPDEEIETFGLFDHELEEEKAKDKKVDVTQGPNEKRAISYLDAMINLPFTNDYERELIITAKDAIRKGRFQNLQRDINKLKKAVGKSPLNPVIILERIITILKSYPLVNEELDEVEPIKIIVLKVLNPEIIITESYT